MKKIFIYSLIISASLLSSLALYATEEESVAPMATMQYEDYLYLNNVAHGNINPTFIKGQALDQLATLEISYDAGKGDFHQHDRSGKTGNLSVDVYGVKNLESVSFEGGMSYSNIKEDNRCWNASLYQAPQNPFILADSVNSNYTTEQFTLDGRFSWEPIELIRFGVNAAYKVGAISDEQDPRLETKGMIFTINPGIDFKVSKYVNIGATAGVNLFNENSRYSTVENAVNSSFFVMKGFGLSLNNGGSSYQRETKGTSWFAALQILLNRPSYKNFLNGGVEMDREKAIDGGTTQQFVGGEYRRTRIFVNDRFSFIKDRFVHNFEVAGEYHDVEGIWYDQKYITENGHSYWETKLKSVVYTQELWSAALKYRFDMLGFRDTPLWTAGAEVCYTDSKIDNYPDNYMQAYKNLEAKLYLTKHFNIRKSNLSITAGGNYIANLSQDIVVDDNIVLKDKYTLPMYEYMVSDSYSVYGKIETKIPIRAKSFTSYIGLFAQASTQRYVGDLKRFESTHFNNFGGGINYTF